MKTPILLKLLQICATKANTNCKKTSSRKGEAGFTLLELIVIVIMLGILAAIAAPSWLGLINRQRVRTVNDRVFQSLRLAQSEAKRTKRDVTVTFSDPSVDPPTVTFDPPLATGGSIQTLNGEGEIKPGQIQLAVAVGNPPATPTQKSLTFKYDGAFDPDSPPPLPFRVTVSSTGGGAKQCVIVDTLIGGMRTAEGNDPATGCP
jgi:type II secretory pathway pseudopilin PulG